MSRRQNIQLNYETSGNKDHPAVLLIHGIFGDLDNLKSISRALTDNYFVINIDVRNHGESPWTDTMSFPEMCQDIFALLDTLSLNIISVLGHSMGGKIAMEFALEFPERVKSLIVADIAPVAYEARHTTILDALESIDLSTVESRSDADKQLVHSIAEKGVRQFLLKNLHKDDSAWTWRMNLESLRRNYETLIGEPASKDQYNGPVMFIRGGESNYVQTKHKDAILARFPKAESKTIEGVGHWLHAEKPNVFNKIVARFLDENR